MAETGSAAMNMEQTVQNVRIKRWQGTGSEALPDMTIGRTGVESSSRQEWSWKPASRANKGVGMTAADSDTDQPPTDKEW